MPEEKVEEITGCLRRKVSNVCLIGMPGCGKTTVGERLAARLGKKFVDIDREIVKRMGKEIPEIFRESGETGFRKMESEVLSEVTKQTGQVVATGGGVVVTPKNCELVRQNGEVIFLKRDLRELTVAGRPVSQSRPLEQIYEERIDAYRSWSDFQVENRTVEKTVREIESLLV